MKPNNDWHTVSAEETAKRLDTNPYRGLSNKEAARRLRKHGKNRIWQIERMDTMEFLLRTAGDLSTVLLVIAAVLALLFEDGSDAVTLCLILALGALLRIVTYVKAKRILETNALENIPTAAVLREGELRLISAVGIVPGDIVLLSPGDTVPCDGRVISEKEAVVSERGITENKEKIRKFNITIFAKPGSAAVSVENRPNMVFAGSTVLKGELRLIATATGRNTLVSMSHGGIIVPSGDRLPLIDRLSGWCRTSELVMLSFLLVISALSLFTTGIGGKTDLPSVFMGAVALAAASMSEYLTTIATIIIAIAARKNGSSRKHTGAVITDCGRIEAIAAVRRVILGDMSLLKSGWISFNSFFVNGSLVSKEAILTPTAPEVLKDGIGEMLSLAGEAMGHLPEDTALSSGGIHRTMSDRELSIKKAAFLFTEATGRNTDRSVFVIDRMSASAVMAAGLDSAILQPSDGNKPPYVASLGDIQGILRCCATYRTPDGNLPLTDEVRRKIFTETARLEYVGATVLAVATRPSPYLTLTMAATLHSEMCFVGFFSLGEPPAEGVPEAIQKVKEARMKLLLLSDNPEHDLYYGHELGLFNKHTKIVPYTELTSATKELPRVIVAVPPLGQPGAGEIRRKIAGEVGGEDGIFLSKEAVDAGAMAQCGCAAAVSRSSKKPVAQSLKNNAQIAVYPNAAEEHGGFVEGITAMTEARRAMINITNASGYLSVSQFTRLFLILLSVVFGLPMPGAIAILFAGILIDFTAVLAMAFEKAPDNALSVPCSPLPGYRTQFGKALLLAVLGGLLLLGTPFLWDALAPLLHLHGLRSGEAITLVTGALFLLQLAFSLQYTKQTPLFRRGTILTSATVVYMISVLVFTLVMLFVPVVGPAIARVFGGSALPLHIAPFALLPGVLMLLGMEVVKRIRQGKK